MGSDEARSMPGALVHSGTAHPELDLLVVAGLATFAAGLGLGLFADRLRGWLAARTAATSD